MEDHQQIVRRIIVAVLTGAFGLVLIAGVGATVGGMAGCSTSNRFKPSGNPLLDVRNPELLDRDRVAAAEKAWAEVESGVRVRERTREAFKSLAWSNSTEERVRTTLIRLLMSDQSEAGSADSLNMARLMLPTERSPDIVRLLAETGVERGWMELTPALVRSFARSSPNVPDAARSERAAIERLNPGMTVEEAVYGVFLRPSRWVSGEQQGAVLRAEDRTRDDAWALLSRLDTTGRARARLIGEPAPPDAEPGSAADVEMLRAALRDFGAIPRTGSELAWLRRLTRNEDAEQRTRNAAWWAEAASAVGSLTPDQRRGFELRHAESVRWAAAHRPDWIAKDRARLIDELDGRLDRRPRQTRDAERGQRRRSERLDDRAGQMSWGDLLTVLVVDEALAQPGVHDGLVEQVGLDRRDESTEYGGILEAAEGGLFRVVLFRPRARDRTGDDRFVASGDMVRFSDRAIGHYHLQVQKPRMGRLAGPSDGDLLYAADSGRNCLVFTSVASDLLNVDIYMPNGVIIDLGMIPVP
jgi:hypothetical protein